MYEDLISVVTPAMRQYLEMKRKSGDCILLFRLGDFYEMFFDDAELVSRELELVLTGKSCGLEERAPMCGIPYHAASNYISRLIAKGYKVAICEQMEDPATAKGLVKRDIIKIYTPGTVTDDRMLEQKVNNYIACVFGLNDYYGFAVSDITTGELKLTSLTIGSTFVHLKDELAKFSPREIVINADCERKEELKNASEMISHAYVNILEDSVFDIDKAKNAASHLFGGKIPAECDDFAVRALGGLVYYLEYTQKNDSANFVTPEIYKTNEFMAIDSQSRRNLELTETMRDRQKKNTLLWVLDHTATAMGGRLLRRWIEQPLIDKEAIEARLDGVEELVENFVINDELHAHLSDIYDIERLANKISMGNINAKDLVSLRLSLSKLPKIKEILMCCSSKILSSLGNKIQVFDELRELLEKAITDEPPVIVTDGGIIKDGYNEEIDRLREAAAHGKEWLVDLETREKELTGIPKLKIKNTGVFGYCIEVTNSFKELVPERYVRKQTLAGSERYVTEELKKIEEAIVDAESNLCKLEYEAFEKVRQFAKTFALSIRDSANVVATADVICALAETARLENYVKPSISEEKIIDIKNGRHPVIEKMITGDGFIPNDGHLDAEKGESSLLVITGPNMAGKSTYMRQTALIVLMAQIGSFVPADSAVIGIADKIFTRVGASDDLARGQSTFMVEMCEVANIIENATDRSLLILDEIGRGTSTFDGLSIAWSVLEYIVKNIGARTLFATHYHELTELEGKLQGVVNYCVDVRRNGGDIVFLRKIKRGGADGSYGIDVAKLAGLPNGITLRARDILSALEKQDLSNKKNRKSKQTAAQEESMDLFAFATASVMQDDILEELKSIDVQKMTPIECMNTLYNLQQRAKERK